MNKQNLIRVLSGLMFLIFFAPFFQTCSDETIRGFKEVSKVEIVTDNTSSNILDSIRESKPENNINAKQNISIHNETAFQKNRKEFTKSGYGLAADSFKAMSEGILAKDFSDWGFYVFIVFSLIPVILLVSFILALRLKLKAVGIINGIIVLLNIICLSILSLEEVLEDISQIQYGYYLFAINLIVIIALCAQLKVKALRDGIDW